MPNYVRGQELSGVLLPTRSHLAEDVATGAKPIEWAVYRHADTSSTDSSPMALVLAPGKVQGFAYGVVQRCCPQSFVASPPPSELARGLKKVGGGRVALADVSTPSARVVPVWGVLFSCSQTNLLPGGSRDDEALRFARALAPKDVASVCMAVHVLAAHAAELDAQTFSATYQALLPAEMRATLATRRVLPSTAYLDVAEGEKVMTDRPAKAICLVSLQMLDMLQEGCRDWTPGIDPR